MDPNSPTGPPPAAVSPGSPFAPAPEQPRLGIIHLMAWTACVALYFSTTRPVYASGLIEMGRLSTLFWLGHGIGVGTALGGLLLLAARRYRGLPFPSQPGETLLVLLGLGALVHLIGMWILSAAVTEQGPGFDSAMWPLYGSFTLLATLVLGVLYLAAGVRTKILRWRLFFLSVVVATVLAYVGPLLFLFAVAGPGRWSIAFSGGLRLLPCALLIAAALADFFGPARYGWTHWLGVAVQLWNGGVLLVGVVCWTFFQS